MDLGCGGPEITSPVSAFDQKLPFGFLKGENSESQAYDKVTEKELVFKAEEKLKKEPLVQAFEGEEDESRSSLDIKGKLEDTRNDSKSEEQDDMKQEPERVSTPDQQQAEDDRVSSKEIHRCILVRFLLLKLPKKYPHYKGIPK